MDLCGLYLVFSDPLWIIFWGIYWLGTLIDILPLKRNQNNTYFLDAITLSLDSFKGKSICVSIVSIIMCLMVFLGSRQIIIGLGCQDIRVMPEGTYCYYVEATNEKGKTYTLPARVKKIGEKTYGVSNVYFDNGGFLYFSDFDYVEYDDEFYSWDQRGNEWHIKFTPNKAYHEKVTETEPFEPLGLIFPCIAIITISLATILYIIRIRQENL